MATEHKACTNCGNLESEHTLALVDNLPNPSPPWYRPLELAHVCPGQIEDIDTFQADDPQQAAADRLAALAASNARAGFRTPDGGSLDAQPILDES